MTGRVLCLGEALIDVIIREGSRTEHIGGSLLNVAVGLAQLGCPTSLCSYWGRDSRGELLGQWVQAAGVEVVDGTDAAPRTPVAYAHLDGHGRARYRFDLTWAVPQLPDLARFAHLHTGSIAATLEPGGADVVRAVTRMREHGTLSYDPNIRPALMHSPAAVVDRVEHLVALADVVKASDEDLRWLYPGQPIEDIAQRWLTRGPLMVIITRGAAGAIALLANHRDRMQLSPLQVTVTDTVGAGDSFMAGLLSGLLDAGLLGSPQARQRLSRAGWPDVQPALRRAVVAAALTVSRPGAYAPTMAEVMDIPAADAVH